MSTAGAVYLARERQALKPPPHEPEKLGPVWQRIRMDADTVVILAAICGCTVKEFLERYT